MLRFHQPAAKQGFPGKLPLGTRTSILSSSIFVRHLAEVVKTFVNQRISRLTRPLPENKAMTLITASDRRLVKAPGGIAFWAWWVGVSAQFSPGPYRFLPEADRVSTAY